MSSTRSIGAESRRHLIVSASSALKRGDHGAAQRLLASLLAVEPHDVAAIQMMGAVAAQMGNHGAAVKYLREAVQTRPTDASLQVYLGISLCASGELDEGIAHLRNGCALDPASATAWFNLGEALSRRRCVDDAVAALRRAVLLRPDDPSAHLVLARIMAQTGRSDIAADEFRHVLQRDPRNADAWFGLSYLDDCYLKPIDAASIADVLSARSVDDPAREKLYFALAKAFEVQQDYERAFDYFRRANEFGRRRAPWNPERAHARVESIKRAFSELTMPTVTGDYGSEAIFIVSLPRSGSTLLEQILASHPDVEGANEIQSLALTIEAESRSRGLPFPGWVSEVGPQDWNRLGQEYLSRAEHWRHGKPRFTDKNLENWLIAGAALLMLPGTRVILLQRDFVETCLACYRQSFGNSRGFTCDLEAMADYCSDFVQLTSTWKAMFPGKVYSLRYEALVADLRGEVAHVLEFCNLTFSERCMQFDETERFVESLPSASQVRTKLRTDTGRAHLYGHRLDHIRERLIRAGL